MTLCIGQHAPPGIPRAFDTFAVPRREFDYQSLPGGGEFELHPRFLCKIFGVASYHGERGVGGLS